MQSTPCWLRHGSSEGSMSSQFACHASPQHGSDGTVRHACSCEEESAAPSGPMKEARDSQTSPRRTRNHHPLHMSSEFPISKEYGAKLTANGGSIDPMTEMTRSSPKQCWAEGLHRLSSSSMGCSRYHYARLFHEHRLRLAESEALPTQ